MISRTIYRICCLAMFSTAYPSVAEAVRVQGIEWPAADDYQAKVANAYRQRIASANDALVSNAAIGSPLFLLSFAKRVDAHDMLVEAESYGLAVKEIHKQFAIPLEVYRSYREGE